MTDRAPAPMSANRKRRARFGRRLGQKYPCSFCNNPFVLEKHGQDHCSAKCKRLARNKARTEARWAGRYSPTRVTQIDSKNAHKIRVSGVEKSRDTPCIIAPLHILEHELFAGRRWEHAVSADGVLCLVARADVREAAYG